jgi:hypothetical protein
VLLYPTYRTLEFPLGLLYRAGREAEISQVLEALQRIAGLCRTERAAKGQARQRSGDDVHHVGVYGDLDR